MGLFDDVLNYRTRTDTKVVNLQNNSITVQAGGYRNPTWIAPYPIAEVTYPDAVNLNWVLTGTTGTASAGTAHTHGLLNTASNYATTVFSYIPQNYSAGTYITISNPTVMDTLGFYCQKDSGTLNNFYLEVFRENPDTSLTRITSNEVSSSITTTSGYIEVTLSAQIICQAGERYLVRGRNSSTTTTPVYIVGLPRSFTSPNISFRTDTSALSTQTTYTSAQAATARSIGPTVYWFMLAAKNLAATPQTYVDDFNRSALGALWFLKSSAGSNQIGTSNNQAVFTGTTDGDENGIYIRTSSTDNCRVDGDIWAPVSGAQQGLLMHSNADLTSLVYLGVDASTAKIYSGSSTSLTQRATVSITGNEATWSLYYETATNTYTALRNETTIGLSWNDSGNTVGHGVGNRYGGIRISRVSGVSAGQIDNFVLRDWAP